MKKSIHKIFNLIADIVFPKNTETRCKDDVVLEMAKLTEYQGDKIIKYPCPAYSFFAYKNKSVRNMIWRLKYHGDKSVAETFALKMYDRLCEELAELDEWSNFTNPLLVPIPVSKHKLKLRGYNQSEVLCKALSDIDEDRFFQYAPNVLYKIKDTISQSHVKDRKERLQNLKDSFKVKDMASIRNKNIILLDDVLTTGSTLGEATEVLQKAGINNIVWVVVAH